MTKVTTAYVAPVSIHRALAQIIEYMHGTHGSRPPGATEITEFQVLDDRGGTGMYRILLPNLKPAQARKVFGKSIDVAEENA